MVCSAGVWTLLTARPEGVWGQPYRPFSHARCELLAKLPYSVSSECPSIFPRYRRQGPTSRGLPIRPARRMTFSTIDTGTLAVPFSTLQGRRPPTKLPHRKLEQPPPFPRYPELCFWLSSLDQPFRATTRPLSCQVRPWARGPFDRPLSHGRSPRRSEQSIRPFSHAMRGDLYNQAVNRLWRPSAPPCRSSVPTSR